MIYYKLTRPNASGDYKNYGLDVGICHGLLMRLAVEKRNLLKQQKNAESSMSRLVKNKCVDVRRTERPKISIPSTRCQMFELFGHNAWIGKK